MGKKAVIPPTAPALPVPASAAPTTATTAAASTAIATTPAPISVPMPQQLASAPGQTKAGGKADATIGTVGAAAGAAAPPPIRVDDNQGGEDGEEDEEEDDDDDAQMKAGAPTVAVPRAREEEAGFVTISAKGSKTLNPSSAAAAGLLVLPPPPKPLSRIEAHTSPIGAYVGCVLCRVCVLVWEWLVHTQSLTDASSSSHPPRLHTHSRRGRGARGRGPAAADKGDVPAAALAAGTAGAAAGWWEGGNGAAAERERGHAGDGEQREQQRGGAENSGGERGGAFVRGRPLGSFLSGTLLR